MPFLEMDSVSGTKRKRTEGAHEKATKSKKKPQARVDDGESQETRILQLEAQILESRRHYNNIVTLLEIATPYSEKTEANILASVSLCRVYCRLLAAGTLSKRKETQESELVIIQWLKARLNEYVDTLLLFMKNEMEPGLQLTALTLLMRLVKEEVNQQGPTAWELGIFSQTVRAVLGSGPGCNPLLLEFRLKYFNEYDDVRFYTLDSISFVFSTSRIALVY